jgi:hypothetical protein
MITLTTSPLNREWLNEHYYTELYFEPCYTPLEDTLYDPDNTDFNTQIIQDVNSGLLNYFDAIMILGYLDDNGMNIHLTHDCITSCLYKSLDEFINSSGYYTDMKNNVIRSSIDLIHNLYNNLVDFPPPFDHLTTNDHDTIENN